MLGDAFRFAVGALLVAACGGGDSGGDGSGDADGTGGTDTGGELQACLTVYPLVPLGYESLAWPDSTPFDADVLSVEEDIAYLNASQTSDFSFRWNEPELATLVSPGEVVSVDMDGNSASFHHWFETQSRLLIAARYQTGLGQDFVVDSIPASQLKVDVDAGTKIGSCYDNLITGEPTYEVFEHAIIFTDGQTELTLEAGESGQLDSAVSNRLAYLKVYQALSFRNAVCDGTCGSADDYQRLIFSQRVDF